MSPLYPQTLAASPAEALRLFLEHSERHGDGVRAAIFATSFKECDAYLRRAEDILPASFERIRSSGHYAAQWTAPSGASLLLDWLPSRRHAELHSGRTFDWIGFHDPANPAWKENVLDYMLCTLRSRDIPCRLVCVETPFTSKYVTPPDIDYLSINEAVASPPDRRK